MIKTGEKLNDVYGGSDEDYSRMWDEIDSNRTLSKYKDLLDEIIGGNPATILDRMHYNQRDSEVQGFLKDVKNVEKAMKDVINQY